MWSIRCKAFFKSDSVAGLTIIIYLKCCIILVCFRNLIYEISVDLYLVPCNFIGCWRGVPPRQVIKIQKRAVKFYNYLKGSNSQTFHNKAITYREINLEKSPISKLPYLLGEIPQCAITEAIFVTCCHKKRATSEEQPIFILFIIHFILYFNYLHIITTVYIHNMTFEMSLFFWNFCLL